MEVKIPEEMAKKFGEKVLREFGIENNSFSWRKYAVLNLRNLTIKEVRRLRDVVLPHIEIRGGKLLLKDIDTWLACIEKGGSPKARTIQGFSSILTEYIARVPGHRVFKRNDVHGEAWLCYYVDEIEYHPEERGSYGTHPAHVDMDLIWEEFGGRKSERIVFYGEDCLHRTPEEALIRKEFYTETPEARAKYLAEVEVFKATAPLIGKQYFAVGIGTDDLDGNDKRRDDHYWWSMRTNRIMLDKDGEPARVVIDVFQENDKEDKEREVNVNTYFWASSRRTHRERDPDEEREREDLPDEDVEEPPVIEIPIHPFVAAFDLRRQLRLRIHINYLTEYVYDPTLGEKLILPKETTELVDMLVAHRGVFKDIIAGKGGGAVVLCCGPPGTGKTLTAEVYAEVTARPLYSVQCSQLGVEPEDLENELLKIFARSQRWKAILLLDEADVYVHRRGDSLQQNAIVGVFLRVLEYYNGIMFLTTNRAGDVDDAVASRCMARIDYEIPSMDDQLAIWQVLSKAGEIPVSDDVAAAIVEKYRSLSGRDVKNLLKLAKLVCMAKGVEVTVGLIDFVKKFKPTGETGGDTDGA